MAYWLFKSEPDEFGIEDLANCTNQRETWNGVRNYQARNYLRDEVKVGDEVLFYHSSCKNVGVAGIAKVTRERMVDPLQFNPESPYYDPKSDPDNPKWFMVEVEHQLTFDQILALSQIKNMPEITQLPVVKKGHRLSIMPVDKNEYLAIVNAAKN